MLDGFLLRLIVLIILFLLIRFVYKKWSTNRSNIAYDDKISNSEYAALDNNPRLIKDLSFKKVYGVVTHVKIATEVSGYKSITSKVLKEIFVELEDGSEFSRRFDEEILVREGHKVTLLKVFFTEARCLWVYLYNENTKEEQYFDIYKIVRNVTKKSYLDKDRFWTPNYPDYYLKPEYAKDKAELMARIKFALQQS